MRCEVATPRSACSRRSSRSSSVAISSFFLVKRPVIPSDSLLDVFARPSLSRPNQPFFSAVFSTSAGAGTNRYRFRCYSRVRNLDRIRYDNRRLRRLRNGVGSRLFLRAGLFRPFDRRLIDGRNRLWRFSLAEQAAEQPTLLSRITHVRSPDPAITRPTSRSPVLLSILTCNRWVSAAAPATSTSANCGVRPISPRSISTCVSCASCEPR